MSANQQLLNHASHHVEHQSSATSGHQQYDGGGECFQCDSQTNVKARYSSSHTGRQMRSNIQTNTTSVCQCQTSEDVDDMDVDVDGSSAVYMPNPDLESGLFDFRSTDGMSTGPSSPRDSCKEFSFKTDESSTYESVLSQTSFSDGMLLFTVFLIDIQAISNLLGRSFHFHFLNCQAKYPV